MRSRLAGSPDIIDGMRLPCRAMPEDEFWQLIAMLEGSTDDEAVERLTAALRTGGKRKAARFAERLAATLYELDREVLFRQPVQWSDDPEEHAPIPLSDDTFLYLRAGIVAKGRAVVERALADPAVLLTRRWDDGEALLYAANEAAGGEIETKHSYETGSNQQHWSPIESDSSTLQTPTVAVLLSDLLTPIEAYTDDSMTTCVEPLEYSWPLWFPLDVLAAVNEQMDGLVRDGGGIPASLRATQIQIAVGFGDAWQPMPEIKWDAMDDTGLGQVVSVHAQLRQAQVRAWNSSQQEAALRSLIATCLLAVLPEGHGSRDGLQDAATEGAHLLTPPS
ncbi:DUF4240 domain-containing protein [Actinoplanes sp. NPDC023801]|uniref:DUF4240 domain-containing protein n=1 Tax=Actinoplanes sp. NPDC023801 TaxID=3154595 RepID=UPI0034046B2A